MQLYRKEIEGRSICVQLWKNLSRKANVKDYRKDFGKDLKKGAVKGSLETCKDLGLSLEDATKLIKKK